MTLRVIAAFSAGLYSGMFLSQTYDMPPVDSLDRFLEHLEHKVQEMKPKNELDLNIPIPSEEESAGELVEKNEE